MLSRIQHHKYTERRRLTGRHTDRTIRRGKGRKFLFCHGETTTAASSEMSYEGLNLISRHLSLSLSLSSQSTFPHFPNLFLSLVCFFVDRATCFIYFASKLDLNEKSSMQDRTGPSGRLQTNFKPMSLFRQ